MLSVFQAKNIHLGPEQRYYELHVKYVSAMTVVIYAHIGRKGHKPDG